MREIKAILDVLPIDKEADQRVSEFLKPRSTHIDNIDTKECTNCEKPAKWNTQKEVVSIPKELLINLYYDWRDHNYEEMGEWFASIREILFEQEAQNCLAEQVIASCDSPEEDRA